MSVPASAGSSADLAARVLGKKLSAILGRPFVIENKVGAGGRIGASEAARAAADGYTLLYGTSITHALYPALVKPLAYDPLKDFIPLGQTF
jgi:tripartite-type tricarboxylate transporter receptor subunit TctC